MAILSHRLLFPFASVAMLASSPLLLPACSSAPSPNDRQQGQTDFTSAPPAGQTQGGRAATGGAEGDGAPADSSGSQSTGAGAPRAVEETDLYRLEGDRLYYLNAYRGLMVFDVTDVDHPQLLGRSAIYGSPVEMIVRNGIAVVVVSDWYGTADDGQPFHGSIVRGIDAQNPANIHSLGEARLGGWVRDTRVVGDVLYAVSEDYGWYYGVWEGGYYGGVGTTDGPKVVVSSVSFSNGVIEAKGHEEFTGYSGVFNVTDSAIMMAHDTSNYNNGQPSATTELQYVDITDAGGAITLRGTQQVKGSIQGWGADNGRWNLDFADKRYSHVLTQGPYNGGQSGPGYVLTTVDWLNANAPVKTSEFNISSTGWSPATRFDNGRMYLSPQGYFGDPNVPTTPIQIYDVSNPAQPALAGSTEISGYVWNFFPAGDRLFALGNEFESGPDYSSQVSLRYLDVTNPASPSVIGTSTFGEGWAWTPAAGTFKAFTMDAAKGLVVLPFSGWSYEKNQYNNGLQLIQFTPTSITTKGAAKTKGWVERGIFVKNRLVSLSDLSLSVIDYSDQGAPTLKSELTLARNIVNAKPQGSTIAELSTDWWGNDLTSSELRVLPIANAEESATTAAVSAVIDGFDARVFRNGNFAYVTSRVREQVPCDPQQQKPGGDGEPSGGPGECWSYALQVQVVDLANNQATLRGKTKLPAESNGYGWGWGFYGCYWWDWYDGADAIQVGGDVLAFRRWVPTYSPSGLQEWDQKLYVVDLADADHPELASTLITPAADAWWGNMRAVGDKLYASHYEWITPPSPNGGTTQGQPLVKYYLDQIDLSDRHNPTVGAKINVPGLLVGASSTDPSILYTIDYRWTGTTNENELAVIEIDGNLAYLQSTITIDGWVGNVFVRNDKAYMSAERYVDTGMPGSPSDGPRISLHEIDLTDPVAPVDRVSTEKSGWGWLLGVEGDRAIITSGWGDAGIDIYKLNPSAAPTFDQFVRTRGWGTSSLARQGNQLFLSSGYWGVQVVGL
jgi:hypothetical protein